MSRRSFLGLLGLGALVAVGGCAGRAVAHPAQDGLAAPGSPVAPVAATGLPPIPAPVAGPARVFTAGPDGTRQVALTIDDGYCVESATAYVEFAQRSGVPITFSPNGSFGDIWRPLARTLAPLIEAGQVQIGNHTFSHVDLVRVSRGRMRDEIERNEAWIESTFGITSRPWFRPPYGARNRTTDAVAASLGFTNILMWNGSFGDAVELTPQALMVQAERWLRPGTVMLGHANHPTITHLFDQVQELLADRSLEPVTLDQMFGTSRAEGRAVPAPPHPGAYPVRYPQSPPIHPGQGRAE